MAMKPSRLLLNCKDFIDPDFESDKRNEFADSSGFRVAVNHSIITKVMELGHFDLQTPIDNLKYSIFQRHVISS